MASRESVINSLEQVDYDIAHIKANLLTVLANFEKAKLEKNNKDILKWKRYKMQQERYLRYAKEFKKNTREKHKELLETWKQQMLDLVDDVEEGDE